MGSTTASHNTGIGYQALKDCSTGTRNVALGSYALDGITGTNNNVAIGYEALTSGSNGGAQNTAFGTYAGQNVSTGSNNTLLGYYSGINITTGDGNVCLGRDTGRTMTGGATNTLVGYNAGYDITTGNHNSCVGTSAGGNITDGDSNTCVGDAAGWELTSGGNNLLLGKDAGRSASPAQVTSGSNYIVLGDNSIANVFIKAAWNVTSDRRDKTDIEPFNHGLSWINKLKPVTYRWDMRSHYHDYDSNGDVIKENPRDGSKKESQLNLGLIAQEELEVEKEHGFGDTRENMLVSYENDSGNYSMKYDRLVPVLVNAIKELSAKNEALEARLAALESK